MSVVWDVLFFTALAVLTVHALIPAMVYRR